MYETKNIVGRGYTVAYPWFEGDGCTAVNGFYETLANTAVRLFESTVSEDRRTVCRCSFRVEATEDFEEFTVTVALVLRRSGRRCGEKMLVHRWKKIRGEWLAVRSVSTDGQALAQLHLKG